YREDEDALRARVDSLEDEASAEHAENERLRAELAEAKAHEKPARDASDGPARSERRRIWWGIGIAVAIVGAIVAVVIVTWGSEVHGTVFSEGGKLGTWQAALTKCKSRGGRFDGVNFYDGNDVNRARVIVDAKGDTYVWVYKDDAKNWGYRAERSDCTTLDAKLTPHIKSDSIAIFDGSLAFDCKLAGGRVHGTLAFKGCYYSQ
ncbi:MAG TPA: hypothetical protein VGG74_11995, partial [Kofleriaceae bacterium]